MTTARLGLVSYLNSKPIGYGLVHGRQRGRFAVQEAAPSALADALARGELDLALLPSIEYARARGAGSPYAIVPGVGITSLGAAESVLLFMRVPASEVRTVAVDLSSRTSAALLRLLFRRRLRPGASDPEFIPRPPDLPAMMSRCDAALVIGDRALLAGREHARLVGELDVLDLGQEWTGMTGLPFVFAFWAGPRREDSAELVAALWDSLDEGLKRIPEIAREFSGAGPGTEQIALRYLSSTIRYTLGPGELSGLEAFYRLLDEERLMTGPPPELSFHGTPARGAVDLPSTGLLRYDDLLT